jgi:hypothetical protein
MAALHKLRGKHLVCAPALSRRRAHRTRKPLKFGSRSALHAVRRDAAPASFVTYRTAR